MDVPRTGCILPLLSSAVRSKNSVADSNFLLKVGRPGWRGQSSNMSPPNPNLLFLNFLAGNSQFISKMKLKIIGDIQWNAFGKKKKKKPVRTWCVNKLAPTKTMLIMMRWEIQLLVSDVYRTDFFLYKVPSKESNYCDLFYLPKGQIALCSKDRLVFIYFLVLFLNVPFLFFLSLEIVFPRKIVICFVCSWKISSSYTAR